MKNVPKFNDGRLHEVEDLPAPEIEYPFADSPTPDVTTKLYRRRYLVQRARYAPKIANRTGGAPDADPSDATAYLVEETKRPEPISRTHAQVWRTFCKIPGAQVIPASKFFSPPSLHDVFIASTAWAVSFLPGTAHIFTSRKTVSSLGDIVLGNTTVAVAAEAFGTLPATTVTFTDSGDHISSFFLNAAAGTAQFFLASNLTDLTSVTVTTPPGSITISWVGLIKSISTAAANVIISGGAGLNGSVTFTAAKASVNDTQTPEAAAYVRAISATGHGGVAGDRVALWNGDSLVAIAIVLSVTTDSFVVPAFEGALAANDLIITSCGFSSDAASAWDLRPRTVSGRRTQRYYLPGVTGQPATAADIPLETPETDAQAFLAAILASTPFIVDSTEDLRPWLGPILVYEFSEIQMADVLLAITP
ncbi:MAG: hypothetical protein KF897_15070 [Opitutaceae bacterium]|nr:hypothetical protein [Opitutaceae bacterium]